MLATVSTVLVVMATQGAVGKAQAGKAAAQSAAGCWWGLAKVYLLRGKCDDAGKWAQKILDSGEGDKSVKQILDAATAKSLPDTRRREIELATAGAEGDIGREVGKAWQMMNQG